MEKRKNTRGEYVATARSEKNLVEEVLEDFKRRQEERKPFEAQWQLNINFLMGNQYCGITAGDTLDDFDKQYFWQEREVYNHIAPLMETRLAKLAQVRPSMSVLPASGDEDDISNAKVCKNILAGTTSKLEISKLVSMATKWSEICGTSFYKIIWNSKLGSVVGLTEVGSKIYEGDVDIVICSPFEIYPDSNSCDSLDNCRSLIHARAYHVDTIKRIWDVDVEGEDLDTYNLSNSQVAGGLGYRSNVGKVTKTVKHDHAMVIEKYELPSKEYPDGRLIIIAGDKLIHDGELPYKNLHNGERGFPFIRQISVEQPSLFWGTSIIERIIPIQRAYNAVKNRKHEFMNRLTMGVLAVEDGSIDIENLEDEGLSPGKVLIYRQGANMPRLMNADNVPIDFSDEEARLLNEFMIVSGVTDILGSNASAISNMSGVALQILLEQENIRITASGEYIRFAIKSIGQQLLRLYKQFVTEERMGRIVGANGAGELFYWNSSNITSDDVVFETETELGQTAAQKRSMIFDLLNAGLLQDEMGRMSNAMRLKTLELLGFGIWEDAMDNNSLQVAKAKRENVAFAQKDKKQPEVSEIDDHDLHISTHTAFMLSGDFEKMCNKDSQLKESLLNHIRSHKQFKKLEFQAENYENAIQNSQNLK